MSLYDTLTLLKSQMHTGHMTPETAMDSLYQAAMNQVPNTPLETRHYEDGTSATGNAPVPDHSPGGAPEVKMPPNPPEEQPDWIANAEPPEPTEDPTPAADETHDDGVRYENE